MLLIWFFFIHLPYYIRCSPKLGQCLSNTETLCHKIIENETIFIKLFSIAVPFSATPSISYSKFKKLKGNVDKRTDTNKFEYYPVTVGSVDQSKCSLKGEL